MIIPRRVLLSTSVIAAFPTFTTPSPAFDLPSGTSNVTFYVTYTEGAAGGRPIFRVLYGNVLVNATGASEDGRDTVIDGATAPTIVAPNASFDFYLSQPQAPDGASSAVTYILGCKSIPGGVRRINLLIAEVGVPATPGTAQITVTGSGP